MPSYNERQRNNIRMGIFVSVSVALGMGIVITLSGLLDTMRGGKTMHTVRFSVESGVGHLKPGSHVRVGGMHLGNVTSIEPQLQAHQPFEFIDVHFALDSNIPLYNNAHILVSSPLIGAEAWLDITSVGDGSPASGVIAGTERIGMLTSILGDSGAHEARQILHNSREFTEFLATVQQQFDESVAPILDHLQATTFDARHMVHSMAVEDWPRWAASIDELMQWATASTDALDGMIAEGHGLLSDGRAVIDENRSDMRSAISNMRQTTGRWRDIADRVNNETLERVHALLEVGHSGLAGAHDAMLVLRQDYDGWATSIGEALGRANLASQQLHLTMTEIRRSPWKVLYRPSEKELEHELLYEAARSFAVAAADLKAASSAMQRVMKNHGDQLGDNTQLLQRVERNLIGPLEKYEIAQQRLLDVLFADSP